MFNPIFKKPRKTYCMT